MSSDVALVVTSIAAPNAALRALADLSRARSWRFFVIGDEKSPTDFQLPGCEFYSLEQQRRAGLRFAHECPVRHYARKNIGYLLACRAGAQVIVETDDDNIPLPDFGGERRQKASASLLAGAGWVNVYGYSSETTIWPRGFPLDAVRQPLPELEAAVPLDCPIQQGLADENPDVDAVFRLLMPLPVRFRKGASVALGAGSWCPFNSQNTTWFRDAFPLLYLPAYCSFRMTDIWRSLVAARVAWEYGWSVLFHDATVRQVRNDHDLMKDFVDEIPGYVHNRRIGSILEGLPLSGARAAIDDNMRLCYQALIRERIFEDAEMRLLEVWLDDLRHA